jgi:hypothetical protein
MLGWIINLDFAAGVQDGGDELGYRFRSNDFNRRRYGGMWSVVLMALTRFF